MPEIYTPAQLADEVQNLAENYRGAIDEISTDNGIFGDISTAVQSKTGQVEPYDKTELADAIDNIDGLFVDSDSDTPIEFGIDANGFYYATASGEGTDVKIGRDTNGLYAIGDVSNE